MLLTFAVFAIAVYIGVPEWITWILIIDFFCKAFSTD